MPAFGKTSNKRLDTCHLDIQRLFREVVKRFDCKVIEGRRTDARQAKLYAQGRTAPGKIVTYADGVTKLSNHQTDEPDGLSTAIDIVPYFSEAPHVRWGDTERFHRFAGFVEAHALAMGIRIRWGGDFKRFKDWPHWELILP